MELEQADKSVKINKAPGLDGLTPEFYKKKISNSLIDPLINAVN